MLVKSKRDTKLAQEVNEAAGADPADAPAAAVRGPKHVVTSQ